MLPCFVVAVVVLLFWTCFKITNDGYYEMKKNELYRDQIMFHYYD